MKALRRLLPVIAEKRWLFVETVLVSALCQLAILALGFLTSWAVGHVAAGKPFPMGPACAAACGLALIAAAATWRESWVSHDLAYRLLAILRGHVFDALRFSLPSRRHARRTGDLTTALIADIETLEWLYAHTVAQSLSALLVLGTSAAISLVVNPLLLLVWVPLLATSVAVPFLTASRAQANGRDISAGATELRSELLDTVRGIRDLAGAGALASQFSRLEHHTRRLSRVQMREASRIGAERAVSDLALSAAAIGSMSVAVISSKGIAPEHLPLAFTAAVAGLGPAAQIADLLRGLGTLHAAAERIGAVLDEPPSVPDRSPQRCFRADGSESSGSTGDTVAPTANTATAATATSATEQRPIGGLRFHDVSFSYTPGVPVLNGLSLHIRPGEIVALTGESGAGKSTAARLALRMWDPDDGRITVDGIDISTLPNEQLRALVSTVPQSSPLLRGTIASNIRLGAPRATDVEVVAAANAAGIFSTSAGLPAGLDTRVGEHGSGLSGGQRARVAMARALIMQPRVLVLDEPTAALDPEADAALLEVLRGLGSCATLLIAHRPDTITAADREIRLP